MCVCYCIGHYCRPGSKPSQYDQYDYEGEMLMMMMVFRSDGHNDNIFNSGMDQPGPEPCKYDNIGKEGQEN